MNIYIYMSKIRKSHSKSVYKASVGIKCQTREMGDFSSIVTEEAFGAF